MRKRVGRDLPFREDLSDFASGRLQYFLSGSLFTGRRQLILLLFYFTGGTSDGNTNYVDRCNGILELILAY
jgi:hypothetical protein